MVSFPCSLFKHYYHNEMSSLGNHVCVSNLLVILFYVNCLFPTFAAGDDEAPPDLSLKLWYWFLTNHKSWIVFVADIEAEICSDLQKLLGHRLFQLSFSSFLHLFVWVFKIWSHIIPLHLFFWKRKMWNYNSIAFICLNT